MSALSGPEKQTFLGKGSAPFQSKMARRGRHVRLAKGRYFFHEGDVCAQFTLLIAGSLRVFKNSENGRQITLYRVKENETCAVNMLSAFFSLPVLASAVAEESSEVLLLDPAVFQSWFGSSHNFRDFVFKSLAARLANMVGLVEQVTFESMDSRLASFLLQPYFKKRTPRHVITKTHGEIAAEVGTAREVVSRRLKEFERKGVIVTGRGRVELLDTALLTTMQGGSADRMAEVCD